MKKILKAIVKEMKNFLAVSSFQPKMIKVRGTLLRYQQLGSLRKYRLKKEERVQKKGIHQEKEETSQRLQISIKDHRQGHH